MSLSGNRYCENCGAQLAAGTRFCEECGHPVEMSTAVQQPPQPQPAPSPTPPAQAFPPVFPPERIIPQPVPPVAPESRKKRSPVLWIALGLVVALVVCVVAVITLGGPLLTKSGIKLPMLSAQGSSRPAISPALDTYLPAPGDLPAGFKMDGFSAWIKPGYYYVFATIKGTTPNEEFNYFFFIDPPNKPRSLPVDCIASSKVEMAGLSSKFLVCKSTYSGKNYMDVQMVKGNTSINASFSPPQSDLPPEKLVEILQKLATNIPDKLALPQPPGLTIPSSKLDANLAAQTVKSAKLMIWDASTQTQKDTQGIVINQNGKHGSLQAQIQTSTPFSPVVAVYDETREVYISFRSYEETTKDGIYYLSMDIEVTTGNYRLQAWNGQTLVVDYPFKIVNP